MAKQKQYVFSARTTEEGLRQLNQLKAEGGIGWDGLVIDAVCAHYGLDKLVMALPKAEKAAKAKVEAGEKKAKEKPRKSAKKAAGETAKETGENVIR